MRNGLDICGDTNQMGEAGLKKGLQLPDSGNTFLRPEHKTEIKLVCGGRIKEDESLQFSFSAFDLVQTKACFQSNVVVFNAVSIA